MQSYVIFHSAFSVKCGINYWKVAFFLWINSVKTFVLRVLLLTPRITKNSVFAVFSYRQSHFDICYYFFRIRFLKNENDLWLYRFNFSDNVFCLIHSCERDILFNYLSTLILLHYFRLIQENWGTYITVIWFLPSF